MESFLGGVRDDAGERAFIPIGHDDIAAISLDDGRLLWRRRGVGRPVAATTARLVALDREGRQYVFRVLDGETGNDVGAIRNHGMPDWASSAGLARDALCVTAADSPEGLRIEWSVRQLYRGGAPPPAEVARQSAQLARGALVLDAHSAAAHAVEPESASPTAAWNQPDAELTSSDAGVIALAKVEDRVFSLRIRQHGEGSSLEIEARRPGDRAPLWQTTVDAPEQEGPPPVRP